MNFVSQKQNLPNLLNSSYNELESYLISINEPKFRAKQIWQWIWQKGCDNFQKMANIKKTLRHYLSQNFILDRPCIYEVKESSDWTIKFLLKLKDNHILETVLIPEKDHYTQCISSQVGCALGCSFCTTGKMGFLRNLTSGEILAQILIAKEYLFQKDNPLPLRNIVFMGMGEPLLNWPQVKRSLEILRDPLAFNFSYRRTTISTVAIPEKLKEVAATGLASLAVSLHAPNQNLRMKLMPRAASFCSVENLIKILKNLPLRSRQKITMEYVLIKNVNDGLKEAKELNKLLSFLPCKINLIPFNPGPEVFYEPSPPERIAAFEHYLRKKHKTVTVRKSKGLDIDAACGQLKGKYTQNKVISSTTF